jgi:CDP-diacylglycerol--serine O-phosphatidyltransferase
MVSRIDIIAFKFKDFSWKNNKVRFTFMGVAAVMLLLLAKAALPFIILLYILFSLGAKAFKLSN